jgi:hypothetical protein
MNKPAFRITHIALAIVAFVTFTCAACAGVVSIGGTADLAAGVDENWSPGASVFTLGISALLALVTLALVAVIVIDLWQQKEPRSTPSTAGSRPAGDRPWERDKGPEDWPRDPLGS